MTGTLPFLRRIAPALALAAVAVLFAQLYFVAVASADETAGFEEYLAAEVGTLATFFLVVSATRARPADFGLRWPRRIGAPLALAGALAAIWVTAQMEPGVAFGFLSRPLPTTTEFAFFLTAAPLTAVAQESVFRGYVMRTVSLQGGLGSGLYVSSVLFALTATNFGLLGRLGTQGLGEYLFVNPGTTFVEGLVLGFYLYKARWNLLGPVVFRTVLLLQMFLSPWVVTIPNWSLVLVISLASAMAVLFALAWLVREPRLLASRYLAEPADPVPGRLMAKRRARRSIRQALLIGGVSILILSSAVVGAQWATGTSRPLLAVASGSMSPTLVRGDLVVIQHEPWSRLEVGDIIAYTSTCLPSPVIHRIVAVHASPSGTPTYQTKGDANAAPDKCPVPYSAVLGEVVLTVPAAGFLVLDPLFAASIAVAAALLVVLASRYRRRGPLGARG